MVSGTVVHEYFPGTAFIASCGDEAEPLDHRGYPLHFAEWLAADHTLPQTLQILSPFVRIHPAHPGGRSRDWPLTHQGLLLGVAIGLPPQATPPPGFCWCDQSRSERVAFHRATHRQKMFIGLYDKGFEAALIEMSCSHRLPMGMPPLRMGEREPVHEARQVAILSWLNDEIPVVGHDAVGRRIETRSQACVNTRSNAL